MQCTFAITPAKNESTGSIVPTTRVIFQLLTKAMIKPVINVVKYCKKIPALSPIPACIFSISLCQRKKINHGKSTNYSIVYYNITSCQPDACTTLLHKTMLL